MAGTYYKQGDYNAVCDVCGFQHKASTMRMRWDGAFVCKWDWEPRHPQDFVRSVGGDPKPVSTARPHPADPAEPVRDPLVTEDTEANNELEVWAKLMYLTTEDAQQLITEAGTAQSSGGGEEEPDPAPEEPEDFILLDETDVSGAEDSTTFYSIEVPEGAKRLTITTSNGTGDSDLYVAYDRTAATDDYDSWPGSSSPTGNETAIFIDPPAGTWSILIHGFEAYSGLSVHAEYSNDDNVLTDGESLSNLAAPSGNECVLQISVPDGAQTLNISANEDSGEFTMYARHGAPPTTSVYDFTSAETEADESIVVPNPVSIGTWYIMLVAGETAPNAFFSGVSLTASVSFTSLIVGEDDSLASDSPPSQPSKGNAYIDQHYGTTVRRVTDAVADLGSGNMLVPIYSRFSPFNCDNTKMIVADADANALQDLYLINPNTGEFISSPFDVGPEAGRQNQGLEAVWHYTDPDILFALGEDPLDSTPGDDIFKIMKLDTGNMTGTQPARTTLFDLEDTNFASATGHFGKTSIKTIYPNATRMWTIREGGPSKTVVAQPGHTHFGCPRYWGFVIDARSGGTGYAIVTYDLQNDLVTGLLDLDDINMGKPDHVDMSWSGDYIVVAWADDDACSSGSTGTLPSPCGLLAYSRDFSSAVGITSSAPHGDWAQDAEGNDVYVYANFDGNVDGGDDLRYTVIPEGTHHVLIEHDFGVDFHVSGTNIFKPGWAVVSFYDNSAGSNATQWYQDKVYAVELVPSNPRIYNLGHTNSRYTGNDTGAPHAASNYDLTRVAWGSNWLQSGSPDNIEMDTLVVELAETDLPTAGS